MRRRWGGARRSTRLPTPSAFLTNLPRDLRRRFFSDLRGDLEGDLFLLSLLRGGNFPSDEPLFHPQFEWRGHY